MSIRSHISKAFLSAIAVTNIYPSFAYRMAAEINWHRCGTELRHCHPVYNQPMASGVCDSETRRPTVTTYRYMLSNVPSRSHSSSRCSSIAVPAPQHTANAVISKLLLTATAGCYNWHYSHPRWLGSRVVSVLDSGAEGPGFKSQSRRCRVTVLGKLHTPFVPLFTMQQNW